MNDDDYTKYQNVEFNSETEKYIDYLREFVSSSPKKQLMEFLRIAQQSNQDFSNYALNRPRMHKDAVEKFFILDRYITNNNLWKNF